MIKPEANINKLRLHLKSETIEKILDALRDQANYSDDQDMWLEIIGEVHAQVTIGKAYNLINEARIRKMDIHYLLIEKGLPVIKKEVIEEAPVIVSKTRRMTGRTPNFHIPVYKKYEDPLKIPCKNEFLYEAF